MKDTNKLPITVSVVAEQHWMVQTLDTYSIYFLVFSPLHPLHGFCHKWITLARLGEPRNRDVLLFALCFISPAIFLCIHFFFNELFDWMPFRLVAVKAQACFPPGQCHCSPNQPDHLWWIRAITPQVLALITLFSPPINVKRNTKGSFEVSRHRLS